MKEARDKARDQLPRSLTEWGRPRQSPKNRLVISLARGTHKPLSRGRELRTYKEWSNQMVVISHKQWSDNRPIFRFHDLHCFVKERRFTNQFCLGIPTKIVWVPTFSVDPVTRSLVGMICSWLLLVVLQLPATTNNKDQWSINSEDLTTIRINKQELSNRLQQPMLTKSYNNASSCAQHRCDQ